jgi:hypothetical protein
LAVSEIGRRFRLEPGWGYGAGLLSAFPKIELTRIPPSLLPNIALRGCAAAEAAGNTR